MIRWSSDFGGSISYSHASIRLSASPLPPSLSQSLCRATILTVSSFIPGPLRCSRRPIYTFLSIPGPSLFLSTNDRTLLVILSFSPHTFERGFFFIFLTESPFFSVPILKIPALPVHTSIF
jgi:hypothetical protein